MINNRAEAIFLQTSFYRKNEKENGFYTINYKFQPLTPNFGESLKIENLSSLYKNYSPYAIDMTSSQKDMMRESMKNWENVANVKFIETSNNVDLYISSSDLNAHKKSNLFKDLGAGWPVNNKFNQMVLFIDKNFGDAFHNRANWLDMHELGHVPFGLKHPEAGEIKLPEQQDSTFNTVMSSNHKHAYDKQIIYPKTPMPLDIKAMHKLYGPNKTHNNNDNIYNFSEATSGIYTIYDTGGKDTIDLRSFNYDHSVSLLGGYENINQITSYLFFAIYDESKIENIITGNGNDILIGNELDNELNAGSGNNILTGNAGKDLFIFTKGNYGHNIITDFQHGQDTLKLHNIFSNLQQAVHSSIDTKDGIKITFSDDYNVILSGYHGEINANDFQL